MSPFTIIAIKFWHERARRGAAKREVMPSVDHRQHRSLNNRWENSHQQPASGSNTSGALRRFRYRRLGRALQGISWQ
jgi:transposase-like protein